ncbi:hypothetical protein GCM10022221_64730 [Actinocorallia aurea]
MAMDEAVEFVVGEALQDLAAGRWRTSRTDRLSASQLRQALAPFAGPRPEEPLRGRLEALREGLAAIAIAVASCHGPMAWCLSRCMLAFNPILGWRSLAADDRHSFGTTIPAPGQLADAEQAFSRLHAFLSDSQHWS